MIVIVGAGAQGRVAREIAEQRAHRVVMLDEMPERGSGVLSLDVGIIDAKGYGEWFVAIGDNVARRRVTERLVHERLTITDLVHRTAHVAPTVSIAAGVLVCAGAVIAVGSVLEAGSVVNTLASVDHDGWIGPMAYLSPGVRTAGRVRIGAGAFIGTGAIIGPGVSIGEKAVIGAGSLVLKDIPAGVKAFGSPATIRP